MKHAKALDLISKRINELERVRKDYEGMIEDYQSDIAETKFQPKIDILRDRVGHLEETVEELRKESLSLNETLAYLSLDQMTGYNEWVKNGTL